MINYLYLIGLISLYFIIRNKFFSNKKIDNIKKFRNKLTNKEAKIEKIFLRNNERLVKDPNINLTIGLYDQESDLTKKTNIHRDDYEIIYLKK